ncbi:MAG: cytochrome P450 [Deltaproteobacteria bacterium]|nr:cytochrome P450 [Deltaproteobacteria bacterium]
MAPLDRIARSVRLFGPPRDPRLPPGPSLPSVAQGAMFVLQIVPFFERCRARWGSTFSLRLPAHPPIVVFSDETAIREILAWRPEDFDVGTAYAWMEPFVGRGSLLLMDGERHGRERRLLMPPFHHARMQAYGGAIRDITRRAMEGWRIDRPIEIEHAARIITLDIILETVFGASGTDLEELRRAVLDLLSDFSVFNIIEALRIDLGPLTPWGRFLAHRTALGRVVYRLIRERRTAGRRDRDDVLAMLVEARYEDDTPMADEALRDELITLVGAGHETSTSALAWVFQCLAHHPDAQQRAHEEVARAKDADAELPWVDAVIKETMRRHPVFPLLGRMLKRPQTIGDWHLPTGTLVYVSLDLTHRNPAHWDDPDRFDPERFLDARPRPFTYIPFGGGTRRCIGMSYALYEMRLIVAEALRRFRIERVGPAEPAMSRGFTLAPSRGARVRLVRR